MIRRPKLATMQVNLKSAVPRVNSVNKFILYSRHIASVASVCMIRRCGRIFLLLFTGNLSRGIINV